MDPISNKCLPGSVDRITVALMAGVMSPGQSDGWCKCTHGTQYAGGALQGTHEQPARSGQRHLDV